MASGTLPSYHPLDIVTPADGFRRSHAHLPTCSFAHLRTYSSASVQVMPTYPRAHLLTCALRTYSITPLLTARDPCGKAGVWPHSMCYVGATLHASQRLRICISPPLTTTTTTTTVQARRARRGAARARGLGLRAVCRRREAAVATW